MATRRHAEYMAVWKETKYREISTSQQGGMDIWSLENIWIIAVSASRSLFITRFLLAVSILHANIRA